MSELIDREATVKQICKIGEMVGGHDRDVVISIALFVQDDKTAFPTVERPHGEWIPCSERLPDVGGFFLITNIDELVRLDYFRKSTNDFDNYSAIAWMPLPAPYKREGDMDG